MAPTSQLSPIACRLDALSGPERDREARLLMEFRTALRPIRETEHGFVFEAPSDPETLARLGEFIGLERLCCPFLTFELSAPSERRAVTLHISGQAGAKQFLSSLFQAGAP